MTLVHRALFTWFILLVFLILLCLRLEPRTHWNWFIVFIPLWVFDAILIIYVIIKIITKWRNLTRLKELLISYQWYIAGVLLKIAAQVMICLKLEYQQQLDLSIYVTMIPIWILLPSTIIYVFADLIQSKNYVMYLKNKAVIMCEDDRLELPEVLKRLEIVPLLPTVKLSDDNLPLSLNPFYYQMKIKEKDKLVDNPDLFGPKCSCPKRRDCIEHSILNQTPFKPKLNNSNSRKVILKEPVLKTIQNCIHHNHIRHKKYAVTAKDDLPDCPTLDALNLEDGESKASGYQHKKKKFTDFGDLFAECNILWSINSVSTGLRKNSKNFTTIQSCDSRLIKNCRKLKKSQLKSNKDVKLAQNAGTSSCSQQARISASSSTCDVTIDELASYFETFVHIPKKMSSMAEMMYI